MLRIRPSYDNHGGQDHDAARRQMRVPRERLGNRCLLSVRIRKADRCSNAQLSKSQAVHKSCGKSSQQER